jgi:parallel beta-helix repeat protein
MHNQYRRRFISAARLSYLSAALASLALWPFVVGCGDGGQGSSTTGSSAQAGSGGSGGGDTGGAGGSVPAGPCDMPHDTEVVVTDAIQLTDALAKVAPGALIRLEPGTYADTFDLTVSGAADKPIVLCGPREAIIDSSANPTLTGIDMINVQHWILSGFTVTGGGQGIYLNGSSNNIVTGLSIHDVGEIAIRLRNGASRNTIQSCEIKNTGMKDPASAEGIFIGTIDSSWPDPNTPDACDETKILSNIFGPGIKTEHIDIKEGTKGGEIRGNTFDGVGIVGANSEDSWVTVTGSGYLFAENSGTTAPKDGFQVRSSNAAWGHDNVFEKNTAKVNGPGYGFYVAPASMGTTVKCDNVVEGAAMGFSNIMCTP